MGRKVVEDLCDPLEMRAERRELQQAVCCRDGARGGSSEDQVRQPASLRGVACRFSGMACWSWGLG